MAPISNRSVPNLSHADASQAGPGERVRMSHRKRVDHVANIMLESMNILQIFQTDIHVRRALLATVGEGRNALGRPVDHVEPIRVAQS